MTHRTRLTVLLAMLTASAASAATTPTVAGTTITNQAIATFDDPSGGIKPEESKSNTVVSVVLPKPDFDIVFKGGSPTDGGTQNAVGTTTEVSSGTLSKTASTSFVTRYSVVNLGNAELTINVAQNVTGVAGTQTVAYYLDTDKDGIFTASVDTPLKDSTDADSDVEVTVAASGTEEILQVITIAASQYDYANLVYGASPQGYLYGTGTTVSGTTVSGNGYTSGATVYENSATSNTARTDLQFTRVELFSVDNTPNPPSTPNSPKTPGGSTYTPPSQGNVDVPTLPGGTPDPTLNTPPVTEVPGYTDGGNTPIVPNLLGDEQVAYPKADSDTNDDVVTFTNVVSNTGSGVNRVQLYPVAAVDGSGNLLTGWSFDTTTATFTQKDSSNNIILRVQFLSPDGTTPIAVASGATYPSFTVDKNSSVYYQTKITYPDTNDTDLAGRVSVTVGIDSREDTGFSTVSTTTDIIYPAAAQFGDDSGNLNDNEAVNGTPVQTVTNYGNFATSSGILTSPDSSDGTAVFPMNVVNNGQYNDTFKLSAKVLNGNTDQGWTVRYFDATGTELKPYNGEYITPVVAARSEILVYAVIDVPKGTKVDDYTVAQTATGYYSTIVSKDENDIIRVATPGRLAIAKFVYNGGTGTATFNGLTSDVGYTLSDVTTPTQAEPGKELKYQIIAKHTYPMAVTNLVFSDQININLTVTKFELSTSASTTTGQLIYSTDGGSTWNVYSSAVTSFSGTLLKWAYDSDKSGTLTSADVLPSGDDVKAVITTEIK